MPNILKDVNKRALDELLNNYNALPWYKKLFYPGALSAALRQYGENTSFETAVTVRDAYLNRTWFFQRWFFSSLVSFSRSIFINQTTIEELPDELLKIVGNYLDPQARTNLAGADRFMHRLFQVDRLHAKFLECVAYGQQEKAERFLSYVLKEQPERIQEALLCRGKLTDYSGRTFNCSAYEYAYWAKDTHMCRMLEPHMNDETKAAILNSITAMESDGLTYEQQGVVVEHSKHFDFTPLITALTRWCDQNRNDVTFDRCAAWMEVGMAQRDIPVYVVNEYCRPDRSFYPRPDFNEGDMPRSLRFYNFHTKQFHSLFPLVISSSSGLGVNFALMRCKAPDEADGLDLRSAGNILSHHELVVDLAAVSHLDEIRTVDLTRLRENLEPGAPDHGLRLS